MQLYIPLSVIEEFNNDYKQLESAKSEKQFPPKDLFDKVVDVVVKLIESVLMEDSEFNVVE